MASSLLFILYLLNLLVSINGKICVFDRKYLIQIRMYKQILKSSTQVSPGCFIRLKSIVEPGYQNVIFESLLQMIEPEEY